MHIWNWIEEEQEYDESYNFIWGKSSQITVFYSMSSYQGPSVKNENTTDGSFY